MRHTMAAPTSAASSASPANTGIVAVLGGNAVATGTSTDATGDVTNKLQQSHGVTIASGEADFTAQGSGTGASASANSGAYVTGADFVIETTVNRPSVSSTGTISDESTTKYIAIDIPGWSPPGGEKVIDTVINLPSTPAPSGGSTLSSGSAVHSSVTAQAVGGDSQATAFSQTHAVNDHLSGMSAVSSWALVAA